jgi:MFS family permease
MLARMPSLLSRSSFAAAFFGWRVVAAAFVVAIFGWGIGFYGPPIYLHEVQQQRGWSVALVSSAVTVHFLVGAVVVANLPALHRRFGLATTTLGGAISLALGVLGWALAYEPWQLFAATVLSGAGWVAMGAAAINAMIAPWFERRRPAALAMAYNGASVGGVILSPLWVAAIGLLGFAQAAMLIGLAMIVIIAALARGFLRVTPAQLGLAPDGDAAATARATPRAAAPLASPWREWRFMTLSAGMTLGLFAQVGLIAHLFSLLVPALGAQGAGLGAALATLSAIAGRTALGWLLPPTADRRRAGALNYLVQAGGCVAFILAGGGDMALLMLGVVLFGLGIGNTTSLPPLIAQAEFAGADVARVVALNTAIAQAAYAFAPAAFGVLRALDGSGLLAFVVAAAIQLLAAGAYLAARGARLSAARAATAR